MNYKPILHCRNNVASILQDINKTLEEIKQINMAQAALQNQGNSSLDDMSKLPLFAPSL